MSVRTFAAIDIGSYELSMKIFEFSKRIGMRQIDHLRKTIDLGSETYSNQVLSFERVDELCQGLKEFAKIMDSYKVEDYKAYGTSAIRETRNTAILLEQIRLRTGIEVEVLNNSEQRFLDYKSIALQGEKFDRYIERGTAILDVGGGSIQISVFERDALSSTQNLKLGILRLQDRMNTIGVEMKDYIKFVDELCQPQLETYKKLYLKDTNIENIIMVDDYISMVLNKREALFPKNTVDFETVTRCMEYAGSMSRQEVSRQLAVSEQELPFLYISLILLYKVMKITGATKVWAPGVTLSDGMAYEYGQTNGLINVSHDFDMDIRACALNISKRYSGSRKRAETIEEIALRIFDAIKDTYGLSSRDRLLLQISAILHDCGKYISMANLAVCSYSIIKNTEIIGISHRERMIIANIVKFNQMIFDYFEDFRESNDIEAGDHMKIAKLTAILRLANGLDRSHRMKFKDVRVELKGNELQLILVSDEDIRLEKNLFKNRADFFEEVYNITPVIKQKKTGYR